MATYFDFFRLHPSPFDVGWKRRSEASKFEAWIGRRCCGPCCGRQNSCQRRAWWRMIVKGRQDGEKWQEWQERCGLQEYQCWISQIAAACLTQMPCEDDWYSWIIQPYPHPFQNAMMCHRNRSGSESLHVGQRKFWFIQSWVLGLASHMSWGWLDTYGCFYWDTITHQIQIFVHYTHQHSPIRILLWFHLLLFSSADPVRATFFHQQFASEMN